MFVCGKCNYINFVPKWDFCCCCVLLEMRVEYLDLYLFYYIGNFNSGWRILIRFFCWWFIRNFLWFHFKLNIGLIRPLEENEITKKFSHEWISVNLLCDLNHITYPHYNIRICEKMSAMICITDFTFFKFPDNIFDNIHLV